MGSHSRGGPGGISHRSPKKPSMHTHDPLTQKPLSPQSTPAQGSVIMLRTGAGRFSYPSVNAANGRLGAFREPIVMQMLFPVFQPGRWVSSRMILDKSGVQNSPPLIHESGAHDTRAAVVGAFSEGSVQLSLAYPRISCAGSV